MARACSMNREMRNAYRILIRKNKKRLLGRPGLVVGKY
jgi:hypothetical protein